MYPAPKLVWKFPLGIVFFIGDKVGGVYLVLFVLASPMGNTTSLLWDYKELCFAYVVYIGFTNGEYHVVCVDFIAPCGGTKGQRRRTLRIPPSLSSGLQLFHPGGYRCGGSLPLTAMAWDNIVCANRVSWCRL